jgi:PAS domain S-box-containing protein
MIPIQSLRSKLLTVTLCLSLIPIAVITPAYYFNAKSALKRQILEQLQAIVESKRIHFLYFMETKKIRTVDSSADGFISDGLILISREGPFQQYEIIRLNEYLSKVKMPLSQNIAAITVTNKRGLVISSTSEELLGINISDQEIFTEAIKMGYGDAYVGQPYYDPYHKMNSLSVSAPVVFDQGMEPIGVMINTYNLSILNEITTNHVGMGETVEAYLVNRDKIMLTESRFREGTTLKQIVDTEPVRRIIENDGEMIGIYKDYRGIPVVGTSKYIPEYGWTLLVEIDKTEAFASLKMLGVIALIFGIVSTGVVTYSGVFLAVSVTKPIKLLKDAAERLTAGELGYRVKITSKDEVGILADSFNIMAGELTREIAEHKQMEDELRVLNESLEQRVMDRTSALTRANDELQKEVAERKRTEEKLKKYEILFSEIRDLAYITDTKNNILFVNRAFERLTGHKPEEFIGKSFVPLFDKENLKKAVDVYTRTLKGESPQFELSFKDTGIICEYRNLPLRDEKETIIGVMGIARDITEHKRMEEALRRSEERLRTVVTNAPIILWALDNHGVCTLSEGKGLEVLGIKHGELVGRLIFDIFGDYIPEIKEKFYHALSVEEPVVVNLAGATFDVRYSIIRSPGGEATGLIGVAIDITERKQVEESLRKSQISLANAQRIAHIGNWEWDIVKNVVTWSDEIYRIFGVEPQAFTANLDAFLDLIHPDDREYVKRSIHEAIYERKPYRIDHRIPLSDVSLRFVHCEGEVIFDTAGRAVQMNGTIQDVTEVKKIEEELRVLNETLEKRVEERTVELVKVNKELRVEIAERKCVEEALRMSEHKYRLLLENLPQRIFYKDRNLVYVSCNENLARDLHIKPGEISGKTDYDFFPKELAEKYQINDRRAMESGQTEEMEEKYVKDGQELIVHTVRTPIKDKKGNIIGVLGIFWDVTEKVILQKEADRSRHLASLGELAAGVGHEINNPITGIINCAQILFNRSGEGSKEKDLARRIMKEGNRIASITSRLLSFARSDALIEKRTIVNVGEVLSDTFILTETQLQKEGIQIRIDLPRNLPGIIAHPQQIQQVFLNTIINARYALNQKYPGTHDDKILEILGEKIVIDDHPYVKIIFCDHGIGIPAHVKDKVMEPFFTTKPRGVGTGLGLSISRGIIQDHGGKLMIDSIEGKFTKVIIMLPAYELKRSHTENRAERSKQNIRG